jgi:Cu/Ag efflux pump CusA
MKINTKVLMVASASFMGVIGITASFLPHELLSMAGIEARGFEPLAVQITGALYLGFAMMNWMSKGITMVEFTRGLWHLEILCTLLWVRLPS